MLKFEREKGIHTQRGQTERNEFSKIKIHETCTKVFSDLQNKGNGR